MADIIEFLHRTPFEPFEIKVSDGRIYTVDHPDFLSRSRNGRRMVFHTEDDRLALIDLSHVTTLEIANGTAAARRKSR